MPTLDRQHREVLEAILSVCTVQKITLHGALRPTTGYRLVMTRPITIDEQHLDALDLPSSAWIGEE